MNFFSLYKRKLIYNLKRKKLIDSDNINFNSLDELFHHYGSDKASIFKKTQNQGHGYSKFYEEKFKKFKKEKINILEIGSFAGASAAAFVKFFSDINVFCFDINISNFIYKSKNIHVYGLDINNEKQVNKNLKLIYNSHKVKNFDLIIDDGSHNLSEIIKSLKIFFKHLKHKGLYIIEDFKHPNHHKYNNNIDHIFVDELLKNLSDKKLSKSSILNEHDQISLINSIEKIDNYKGNLIDSEISFITKK